jgi:segregation and condensation protein A
MTATSLDLDLDVFAGPFDLLLAVVLREEIDLLEVDLSDIVLAYIEHLEREDELDLEVATEFLVLIASLLELKSRLMLPGAEDELAELGPEEAVEELVARMLEYRRYRDAAAMLVERFEAGRRHLHRAAPLPPELRRVSLEAATATYEPQRLAAAIGDLLGMPPDPDTSHIRPTVSLERRLGVLRDLLTRRGDFDFDEAFSDEDRLTQAVTLFALLEMHRKGEATWEQRKAFGPITVKASQ